MDIYQEQVKRYAKLNEMERKKEQAKKKQRRRINRKLNFLKVLSVFMIIGLLGRVGYIKAIKGSEYERITIENQANRFQTKTINPNRGTIVDRNKQNIAISNIVYRVILDVRLITAEDEIDRENIKKGYTNVKLTSEKTFADLSEIMGITLNELNDYISKDSTGKLKYDTNWLDIGIIPHTKAMEIKNSKNIKCVFLFEESERNYIYNNFAPQVIGFTRSENQWGLEKYYNSQLKGIEGRVFAYGDENGVVQNNIAPVAGNTIVSTLDFNIQQIAQNACDENYEYYEAENTAVIVMNPNTGEILAMAQSPTFNLNDPANIEFVNSELIKNNWDSMESKDKADTLSRVWTNYNVSSTFEPGSIFKPMVVAAALEENIITPESPAAYFCGGHRKYAGWDDPIPCHFKPGHGNQTLDQVLANSCNVAMMIIGDTMGPNLFYKYQRDFGFGEKTGIDLPVEIGPLSLIYSLDRLNPVELATSSFGQGFSCTPIQAITAFASLINGGNLMKPYIVSQVIDENGNVVLEREPSVVRKVISRETSDYLRNTMVKVVTEGTGKRAAIEGYNIGGKTGTGQQGKRDEEKYTVSFIAYLPAENPEILAMAIINKPKEYIDGVTSAAPMLKDVLLNIIKYRGIHPSDSEASLHSLSLEPDNIVLGNYKGMSTSDAIASLNRLGVNFEILGPGGSTVTSQIPPEGSGVDSTSVVYLNISSEDGETLVGIPDIAGLTLDQAVFVVENCGLVPVSPALSGLISQSTEDSEEGESVQVQPIVTGQMPAKDVKVPSGTQVIIKTN